MIVPVFGLANAGVSLTEVTPRDLLSPLPLGVAAGLFFGKQIGVLSAVWLCQRFGIASRPGRASWLQIYGTALLCGIGFTMSLFIGSLAFSDALLIDEVKIGVLGGSLMSGLAGFLVLRLAPPSAQ
jgi:NhaA family Na+:H+ antiporter